MTASHRSWATAVASMSLMVLLAGCISSKPQPFKYAFLPATPSPNEPAFEEPPKISTSYFAGESPKLIDRMLAVAPRIPEVDVRIAKAEDRFEAGKKLYQLGNAAAARREFDAAVDLLLSAPENLPDRQRLERRLDQMVDAIYRYDLEGLGALQPQKEVVYDKAPIDNILEMTFPTDPNLRPKVKEEIEATVSQLPLEENDAVLSYIHYFSTDRGRKTLIGAFRRAGHYRPLIQRILDEEGVPQELIYLAQVESGFLPRARSYKAAVGMWQFVQFRGREYGLEQTPATDDRMDPEKATRAAARHLRDLYAMFGDWYLAMAAYNCGPGCVERAVERTGFADYWELSRLNVLPKQTINYVPLILAVTIMAKNAKDYNLENLDYDQPIEYDTVEIAAPTNLALIADAAERTVPEIQELNPALLKSVAPSGYQLHVPKGTAARVSMALDVVPAVHRASWRIHRVSSGETLAEIAKRYSTAAASIAAANHSIVDLPEPGDLLVIPAANTERTVRTVRTAARHTRTSTSHRPARRAVAGAKKPVPGTAHKSTGPYRTASLAARHRASAN